jgi:hypothetical protein
MGEDIEFWPKIKYLLPFLIFSPHYEKPGVKCFFPGFRKNVAQKSIDFFAFFFSQKYSPKITFSLINLATFKDNPHLLCIRKNRWNLLVKIFNYR